MHAHTGVFGPAVRTNASRLGREVRNGGYPVWAICRLQAVLFYIFNRFDDIKLLVRRQPTESRYHSGGINLLNFSIFFNAVSVSSLVVRFLKFLISFIANSLVCILLLFG